MIGNKVILVTGGIGLLGKAFCEGILQNNGFVVIADIKDAEGPSFEEELNNKYGDGRALFIKLDITSPKNIQSIINEIKDRFGKIDAIVNNAYPKNKNYGRHFFDVEYEDFCENTNLHLGGYFLMCQQFANYFKIQGSGNIINIASIYGVIAPRFEIYEDTNMTMPVEYAVIKASIIHLTKYLAKYLKGTGIRVNSISPGGVLDNQPESFINCYNSNALSKGMLNREDIVGTLLFLLSDDSKYLNGQNLIIDDGFTL